MKKETGRKIITFDWTIGFEANRRLLEVETISQDCTLAEAVFEQVTKPQRVDQQRVAGLRFDDLRVMVLMQIRCLFLTVPQGFRNATMRQWMVQALGIDLETYTSGSMTYDLRRLRLHGLIERIPHTHRYRITALGAVDVYLSPLSEQGRLRGIFLG